MGVNHMLEGACGLTLVTNRVVRNNPTSDKGHQQVLDGCQHFTLGPQCHRSQVLVVAQHT